MDIFQRWMNTTIPTVSFEEVKMAQIGGDKWLINTLPQVEQDVLISGTIPVAEEESKINADIENYDLAGRTIILYGKNCHDPSVETKYRQLVSLGAKRVSIYRGGLFEWLLLQDIYGSAAFPTTKTVVDILKYK